MLTDAVPLVAAGALYWFAISLALLALLGFERYVTTEDGDSYTDVNGLGSTLPHRSKR